MKRFWRTIKGSINMFVAMMLIPTVAFTGLMVDFARIRMMSSQIRSAADIAASSAAAYYDGLLKDVYGLFAVSQDNNPERDKFVIEYAKQALGLDAGSLKKADNSMNLIAASASKLNVEVRQPIIDGKYSQYSLRNSAYAKQQIGQYMKYRIGFSLLELFEITSNQGDMFADAGEKAINAQNFAENDYNKEVLARFYDLCLKYVSLYEMIVFVENWQTEGAEYVRKKEEEIAAALDKITGNEDPGEVIELTNQIQKAVFDAKQETAHYERVLNDIRILSDEIEQDTANLKALISQKKQKLNTGNYDMEFRNTMSEELDNVSNQLVEGIKTAGNKFYSDNINKFPPVKASLDEITYGDYTIGEVKAIAEYYKALFDDPDYEEPEDGEEDWPLDEDWEVSVNKINITLFDRTVYNKIKTLETDGGAQKKAEDDIKKLEDDAEKDNKEIEEIKRQGSKSIPPSFYNAWKSEAVNTSTADSGWDNTLNRLLLTEYGMQSFTNYITGKKIQSDGEKWPNTNMISGIPKSEKLNHIYRYEVEYLAFGDRSGNFEKFIGIMTAIFFVANYLCTFRIGAIKTVTTALRAIWPPPLGWALAELYRLAVAVAETASDVNMLLNGKKAVIIKNDRTWKIANWSYQYWSSKNGTDATGAMYYDEYLRIFILFNFGDSGNNTLTTRIMNLIELNMNHYKGGTDGIANRNRFLLKEAYTVTDVAIDAEIPYFFIPVPFTANAAGESFDTKAYKFRNITGTRGY